MNRTPIANKYLTKIVKALSIFIIATPIATKAEGGASTESATDSSLPKVLTILANGSVTSDSNLFRRPAVLAQSETISTAKLGLRLDKSYGQQSFQLEAAQTLTKYQKFKYLDFDALNYSGAWRWQSGARLSGQVTASRSESLAPFEDFLGTQRNVRISQNQAFDVDAWAFDGWHVLLGTSQSDQKSEQSSLINRTPDFRATSENIGLKYQTRSGDSITARWQTTDGTYLNNPVATLNSDYTENLSEISADWTINGISKLNARIGWLDRKNADVTRRNFSGPSSGLNYSWAPRGKLSVAVSAARNTAPLQVLGASYKEDNSLSITPTWRTTEKTNAFLTLGYQKSNDRGSGITPPAFLRKDTTQTATVGINWLATRKLSISASLQNLQRSSNNPLAEYKSTIASINAGLSF